MTLFWLARGTRIYSPPSVRLPPPPHVLCLLFFPGLPIRLHVSRSLFLVRPTVEPCLASFPLLLFPLYILNRVYSRTAGSLTTNTLRLVLCLGFRDCLPLHVIRAIGTATC